MVLYRDNTYRCIHWSPDNFSLWTIENEDLLWAHKGGAFKSFKTMYPNLYRKVIDALTTIALEKEIFQIED